MPFDKQYWEFHAVNNMRTLKLWLLALFVMAAGSEARA